MWNWLAMRARISYRTGKYNCCNNLWSSPNGSSPLTLRTSTTSISKLRKKNSLRNCKKYKCSSLGRLTRLITPNYRQTWLRWISKWWRRRKDLIWPRTIWDMTSSWRLREIIVHLLASSQVSIMLTSSWRMIGMVLPVGHREVVGLRLNIHQLWVLAKCLIVQLNQICAINSSLANRRNAPQLLKMHSPQLKCLILSRVAELSWVCRTQTNTSRQNTRMKRLAVQASSRRRNYTDQHQSSWRKRTLTWKIMSNKWLRQL